jgi:hypothetical protein
MGIYSLVRLCCFAMGRVMNYGITDMPDIRTIMLKHAILVTVGDIINLKLWDYVIHAPFGEQSRYLLHCAAEEGQMAAIQTRMSLYYRSSNNYENYAEKNILLGGAAAGGHINIVEFLVLAGASNITAAFKYALSAGQNAVIEYLLSRGLLHAVHMRMAATHGNAAVVAMLLAQMKDGPDVEALELAAEHGRENVVLLLLASAKKYRAHRLAKSLALAISGEHANIVEILTREIVQAFT